MSSSTLLPPANTAPAEPLPGAWAMSIRELDSWHDYYEGRLRAGLSLTNTESVHRAEVARNIAPAARGPPAHRSRR
jgi:hypothetical protein